MFSSVATDFGSWTISKVYFRKKDIAPSKLTEMRFDEVCFDNVLLAICFTQSEIVKCYRIKRKLSTDYITNFNETLLEICYVHTTKIGNNISSPRWNLYAF